MANQDQSRIGPETNVTVSKLNYHIERADTKMIELVHKNRKTGEDERNKAEIEVLREDLDQASAKKRVNEIMTSKDSQLGDYNILDSVTSLSKECKTFKVEVDGMKNRLIELSLKFDKANDAQSEKDVPTLSSDSESEESEVEKEMEEFKQKGDLRERFLAKLIDFDSVDEFEDDEVFACNADEGSEELKKEETVRGNTMENKWVNYLQLDGFDHEFHTNIEGLKEEMCSMMFQDGKYKKVKYNEKKSS
ncbi:hypothetical protein CCACVL1_14711 [Corchorus capsularis]|uniref:Uncharacterized protein n=1 Tax=Corchorus capsularis TaxID=210143 RepID=A0A1R3I602_COCAP|nr:hypothetical protein CCACVL1_14711 [Corchorus capsularis]